MRTHTKSTVTSKSPHEFSIREAISFTDLLYVMWSASPKSTSYHCLYLFEDDDDMEDEEGEEEEPKVMDEAVRSVTLLELLSTPRRLVQHTRGFG